MTVHVSKSSFLRTKVGKGEEELSTQWQPAGGGGENTVKKKKWKKTHMSS